MTGLLDQEETTTGLNRLAKIIAHSSTPDFSRVVQKAYRALCENCKDPVPPHLREAHHRQCEATDTSCRKCRKAKLSHDHDPNNISVCHSLQQALQDSKQKSWNVAVTSLQKLIAGINQLILANGGDTDTFWNNWANPNCMASDLTLRHSTLATWTKPIPRKPKTGPPKSWSSNITPSCPDCTGKLKHLEPQIGFFITIHKFIYAYSCKFI